MGSLEEKKKAGAVKTQKNLDVFFFFFSFYCFFCSLVKKERIKKKKHSCYWSSQAVGLAAAKEHKQKQHKQNLRYEAKGLGVILTKTPDSLLKIPFCLYFIAIFVNVCFLYVFTM